jgi:hypothetical protein
VKSTDFVQSDPWRIPTAINFLLNGLSDRLPSNKESGMASERPQYYLARATEERAAAASAPTPAIARTHSNLAAMYDRMAREAERALEFELVPELAD